MFDSADEQGLGKQKGQWTEAGDVGGGGGTAGIFPSEIQLALRRYRVMRVGTRRDPARAILTSWFLCFVLCFVLLWRLLRVPRCHRGSKTWTKPSSGTYPVWAAGSGAPSSEARTVAWLGRTKRKRRVPHLP